MAEVSFPVLVSPANAEEERSLRAGNTRHGRSQDFSKGGSHCVKQRVLAFSQPEYCRLMRKKRFTKGGSRAPQEPPPPPSYALDTRTGAPD